jgi:hypothetical protein
MADEDSILDVLIKITEDPIAEQWRNIFMGDRTFAVKVQGVADVAQPKSATVPRSTTAQTLEVAFWRESLKHFPIFARYEREFKSLSKDITTGISTLHGLGRAALGLGGAGVAGAALASLYGLGRDAAFRGRFAAGIGGQAGSATAADIYLQRYINPQAGLAAVARGQNDITSPQYLGLNLLGLAGRQNEDPAKLLGEAAVAWSRISKTMDKTAALTMANAMKVDSIFDQETLIRLRETRTEDVEAQNKLIVAHQEEYDLTKDQIKIWTDLGQKVNASGSALANYFEKKLIDAAPEIDKFIDDVTTVGKELADLSVVAIKFATDVNYWLNKIEDFSLAPGKYLWKGDVTPATGAMEGIPEGGMDFRTKPETKPIPDIPIPPSLTDGPKGKLRPVPRIHSPVNNPPLNSTIDGGAAINERPDDIFGGVTRVGIFTPKIEKLNKEVVSTSDNLDAFSRKLVDSSRQFDSFNTSIKDFKTFLDKAPIDVGGGVSSGATMPDISGAPRATSTIMPRGGGLQGGIGIKPSKEPLIAGGGHVDANSLSTATKLTRDLEKDFGLTRTQAMGIVGNLAHESGDFKEMQEKGQPMGRGGWGWAQWTGPRRREFFDVTAGMDPKSYEANYKMLKHDLEGDYRKSVAELKRQNTIEGAATSFERTFERAGVVAMGSRINRGERYNKAVPQDLDSATSAAGITPAAQPARPVSKPTPHIGDMSLYQQNQGLQVNVSNSAGSNVTVQSAMLGYGAGSFIT